MSLYYQLLHLASNRNLCCQCIWFALDVIDASKSAILTKSMYCIEHCINNLGHIVLEFLGSYITHYADNAVLEVKRRYCIQGFEMSFTMTEC